MIDPQPVNEKLAAEERDNDRLRKKKPVAGEHAGNMQFPDREASLLELFKGHKAPHGTGWRCRDAA